MEKLCKSNTDLCNLVTLVETCFNNASHVYTTKSKQKYTIYKKTNGNTSPSCSFYGLRDSKYIHPKILKNITTKLNNKASISLQYKSLQVDLHIYHTTYTKKYEIEFLVFYTYVLMTLLTNISDVKKTLQVKIFLTSCKKTFPKSGDILGPGNVNSGVTISYLNTNNCDVYILRKEEVLKVLLHEMIHALRIDFGIFSNVYESDIMQLFNAQDKLAINESYTDTLACMLNVCIYSVIYKKMYGSQNMTNIYTLMNNESMYILQKAKQVLKHCNISFTHTGIIRPTKKYIEHTHALSYYLLKSLNFYNLPTFMKFISGFKYVLRNEEMYVKMLQMFLKDTKYWKFLSNIDILTDKSLRMSSIDTLSLLNNEKEKLLKTLLR